MGGAAGSLGLMKGGMLVAAAWALAGAADAWTLKGDLGVHDPSLIREGGHWWLAGTGRGVSLKCSDDGRTWAPAAPAFSGDLPWWRAVAPHVQDVWAPDLHRYRGRVWMYYALSSEFGRNISAIGLASRESMDAGTWRDDGLVLQSTLASPYNAIDPNLALDADDAPWLVFGSWFDGIHLVKLDPATMKPTGPLHDLARRPDGVEGACLIRARGYYYLFVSTGLCCRGLDSTYRIACGRAKAITGPYLDRAGVDLLRSGGTLVEGGDAKWHGVGGQSVVQDGDAWILVRHGYDAGEHGAPKLLISGLRWDAQGWPTAGPTGGMEP